MKVANNMGNTARIFKILPLKYAFTISASVSKLKEISLLWVYDPILHKKNKLKIVMLQRDKDERPEGKDFRDLKLYDWLENIQHKALALMSQNHWILKRT